MLKSQTTPIALMTGGNGPERFGSLRSGESVINALTSLGVPHDVYDISDLAGFDPKRYEFAFLTTHGWFGEDGKLQGFLEHQGLAYTGSGVLASAVGMYKPICNQLAQSLGLKVPPWTSIDFGQTPLIEARRIVEVVGHKVIAKPVSGGGSIDAIILDGVDEIVRWLKTMDQNELQFMAQRYVKGLDVTIGIVDGSSGATVLPPLSTEYASSFYDFDTKHDATKRKHVCPAEIGTPATAAVRSGAERLFSELKAEAPFRADFLVDEEGQAWFLEVNTIPGLSREGNLATMAKAHGITYEDLIANTIKSARRKEPKGYRQ